tara:strand:+ start:582 stop:836 length:255 start_codon:yes stop_codon:yes gene_type:complete
MNTTTNIILTTLLVLAHAIELTYELGKASAPYIKMAVAFVITLAVYTYENRHRVGKAFIYESPSRLKAPRYIRSTRIPNTLALA